MTHTMTRPRPALTSCRSTHRRRTAACFCMTEMWPAETGVRRPFHTEPSLCDISWLRTCAVTLPFTQTPAASSQLLVLLLISSPSLPHYFISTSVSSLTPSNDGVSPVFWTWGEKRVGQRLIFHFRCSEVRSPYVAALWWDKKRKTINTNINIRAAVQF